MVPDRYPLRDEKKDEEGLWEHLFSHVVMTEGPSRLYQSSESPAIELLESNCSSPLTALASDDEAVHPFGNANPEPPESFLSDVTSSRSSRSSPSLSLNFNGKRIMTSFAENDNEVVEESEAAPPPGAKRPKKTPRAPAAAVVAGPSNSDRVLRTRRRSGPIARRSEAREGARADRRIASTID